MGTSDNKLLNGHEGPLIQNGHPHHLQNGSTIERRANRDRDRETLRTIIKQWNANRLDLFELSEPDENLDFYGIMRFYHQEDDEKVNTKCVRITSRHETREVVEMLIEKFRPDMRMLTQPHYGLYEVHANGEERRLKEDEKPLLVQLNWHKDDREGRFLLKNEDEQHHRPASKNEPKEFKRRLSHREKKEQKKKGKEMKLQAANDANENDAEKLFKSLPETSFHRSISNPEAVMKRRRQQKLEKKLQQFKSRNGGPDSGGTLKIFGETINPDVPYKTLLLSIDDTVESVLKQALEKYGLDRETSGQYCLVQAVLPPETSAVDPSAVREMLLAPTDCPLRISMQFDPSQGALIFSIKKRADMPVFSSASLLTPNPYLIELPQNGHNHAIQLFPGVMEVGNNHSRLGAANFIHLPSPDILPVHCIIRRTDNSVTLLPSGEARVVVDARQIEGPSNLLDGATVVFGQSRAFKFYAPQHSHFLDGNLAARERLQLPLKPSTDLSGRKPVAPSSQSQDNAESDILETNSSLGYSRRSSPDVHHHLRHVGMSNRLPILPATLEFREDREDSFLFGVISNPNPIQVGFKLSPTYVLYMAARYRASTNFRPEIVPVERATLLSKFLKKVGTGVFHVLQEHHSDPEYLAFWMANSAELLQLLKLDRHMSPYAMDGQETLTECIHLAFHHLIRCQQDLLQHVLPKLFASDQEDGWGNVLNALSTTMQILRRCRLNAGLTIQVFSQLFHFVNMWLFNTMLNHPENCNCYFGQWMQNGLERILSWAETQGLEIAADCHLSKIIQAAAILAMPKSADILVAFPAHAWRLNSHQVRFILSHYEPNVQEDPIPQQLIEMCASNAHNTVDSVLLCSGQNVQLQEEPDLQAAFVIPEDGYSFEMVTQVPAGLQEFLEPLTRNRICEMTVHPFSHGTWTVYLQSPTSGERSPSTSFDGTRQYHPTQHVPNVIEVSFPKGNSGIGLSIVAAKNLNDDKLGIYVKSVVKGGAADLDGRLQSGDQLLKVNGKSLVGVTQDRAAELISQTGPQVHIEALKQGAIANGLATLLDTPSPPPNLTGQSLLHKPVGIMKPLPPYPGTAPDSPNRNGTLQRQSTLQRTNGHPVPPSHPVNHVNHPHPSAVQQPVAQLTNGHPANHRLPPSHHHMGPHMNNSHVSLIPPVAGHHQQLTPTRQPQNVFDFSSSGLKPPLYGHNGHPQTPPHPSHAPNPHHRSPSPVHRMIASNMNADRDKIRQESKMIVIEDELRRRREQMTSPVPNGTHYQVEKSHTALPAPLSVVSNDSVMNGTKPRQHPEKRVQWALDPPSRTDSSPEIQPQPARVPVVPTAIKPAIVLKNSGILNGMQQMNIMRELNNVSPSQNAWQREENERVRERKLNENRRMRDDQIAELEARRDSLRPEERNLLEALLLERKFQERADEVMHRNDEEEDEGEEDEPDTPRTIPPPPRPPANISVPTVRFAPSPHHHHPQAAAQPDVHRTQQQHNYDQFVRLHEAYTTAEAVQRNGDQLMSTQTKTYPVPNGSLNGNGPVDDCEGSRGHSRKAEAPMNGFGSKPKQSYGMEIRNEVEISRAVNGVVGNMETYNDPRNRMLNAKAPVKPPVGNETSPEKLSFQDKMKMFAVSVGENVRDKAMTSSRQREIEHYGA